MFEYFRLIDKDFFRHFTRDWDRQDTLICIAVLAGLVILGLMVTRRK